MIKFTSAIALALTLFANGPAFSGEFKSPQAEARSIIKNYVGDLKANLISAIKDGGPANAIKVCQTVAVPLADHISEDSGWKLARTSLRLRNQANAADEWELKVMMDFARKRAAGANPKKLEYSEVVSVDGKKTFRYMKAIPTKAVCLKCHGTAITDNVKNKLTELYPNDKATGYKAGQIRGVFTLSKVIK